jgi:hypothetical protein
VGTLSSRGIPYSSSNRQAICCNRKLVIPGFIQGERAVEVKLPDNLSGKKPIQVSLPAGAFNQR